MERLTKVDDQGRLLAYSTSDTGLPTIVMSGNPYREIIERLKAYEDTGMTPEEIMDGKMLTGWIPVGKRLPAPKERVLMYRPCMEGAETGPVSVQWGWAYKDASHWMPVPCAPEN